MAKTALRVKQARKPKFPYAPTPDASDAAVLRRYIASSASVASVCGRWRTRASCPASRNRRGDRHD